MKITCQWYLQAQGTLNIKLKKVVSHCNLIVDIGNSFIKLAIYKGDKLVTKKSQKTVLVRDIKAIFKKYKFKNVIVSTVRQKNPRFVQHLSKNYHLLLLSYKTKTPIVNTYKTPKTLGLDRLAGAVGGFKKFQRKDVLIIDLGTCAKYDFVDKAGVYHGGNIAPGLEMRLESMHILTSKLPRVKRSNKNKTLGQTTTEALQNGAVLGLKSEIEGFIKTLTKKKGKITVILTGGDSEYFGEMIESKIFVLPNLVLDGLNEILLYNQAFETA